MSGPLSRGPDLFEHPWIVTDCHNSRETPREHICEVAMASTDPDIAEYRTSAAMWAYAVRVYHVGGFYDGEKPACDGGPDVRRVEASHGCLEGVCGACDHLVSNGVPPL